MHREIPQTLDQYTRGDRRIPMPGEATADEGVRIASEQNAAGDGTLTASPGESPPPAERTLGT